MGPGLGPGTIISAMFIAGDSFYLIVNEGLITNTLVMQLIIIKD